MQALLHAPLMRNFFLGDGHNPAHCEVEAGRPCLGCELVGGWLLPAVLLCCCCCCFSLFSLSVLGSLAAAVKTCCAASGGAAAQARLQQWGTAPPASSFVRPLVPQSRAAGALLSSPCPPPSPRMALLDKVWLCPAQ